MRSIQTKLPVVVSPISSQEPSKEECLVKIIRRDLLAAQGVKFYER